MCDTTTIVVHINSFGRIRFVDRFVYIYIILVAVRSSCCFCCLFCFGDSVSFDDWFRGWGCALRRDSLHPVIHVDHGVSSEVGNANGVGDEDSQRDEDDAQGVHDYALLGELLVVLPGIQPINTINHQNTKAWQTCRTYKQTINQINNNKNFSMLDNTIEI